MILEVHHPLVITSKKEIVPAVSDSAAEAFVALWLEFRFVLLT